MPDDYSDFEIRIDPTTTEGVYSTEASLDGDSGTTGAELRLDWEALLQSMLDPQSYGLLLFKMLFTDEIRAAYERASGAAMQSGRRLRIRLRISDKIPELHAVAWERLYHIHRGQIVPLAANAWTPFSRYMPRPTPIFQPIKELPVRLLFVISNPKDLPAGLSALNVAGEVENLHAAIGGLQASGQVQITLLPGRTGLPVELHRDLLSAGYQIVEGATDLDRVLRHMDHQHILHFLGHGRFKRGQAQKMGSAFLYLEKEDGGWQVVEDESIKQQFNNADWLPHLVFLAACQSASRDKQAAHPFVGLAPKLVQAGVPAVVAMQDIIPMDVARQLTGDFYRRVLQHGLVDRALNEARNLLFEGDQIDWAIPVLFMYLREGRLFAADPIRSSLQAIHHWAEPSFVPLPMAVVRLTGRQDLGSLERVEQEQIPSIGVVDASMNAFSEPPRPAAQDQLPASKVVLLVGRQGTAKSTQLRRIAQETASRSLAATNGPRIIPIVVDLAAFPQKRSGLHNPVELLVLETLAQFWPGLEAKSLSDLPGREHGLILRFLFDGIDDVPDRDRHEIWSKIESLIQRYRDDQFMIAVDTDHVDRNMLDWATDILIVQRLSRRTVERFLNDPRNAPTGQRLFDALTEHDLFDLAAIPWLLQSMLDQTSKRIIPSSRAIVLEHFVEEAVSKIPTGRGMQARTRRTLYTLARVMQFERKITLTTKEAFEIMADVRGNREYSLEELTSAFVDANLLVRVGEEGLRFTYPPLRSYCSAQAILDDPGHDRLLDDITASLGRIARLRWWEGTLILMSGLMPDPNVLYRRLLYGTRLADGEETMLAVRCLMENRSSVEQIVMNQVVDALLWLTDQASEHRTAQRDRAIRALGQLRQSSTIPILARLANGKDRLDWQGNPAYELSSTRMAASAALYRMMDSFKEQIKAADAQLAELLTLWLDKDVPALNRKLLSGEEGISPITAFALGHLNTEGAVKALYQAARDPGIQPNLRWAVTDGLVLLDPDWVTRQIIIPFIEEKRSNWYNSLAYLIGKIRTQDPVAHAFLERCLDTYTAIGRKARAIQSLGWLYDHAKKPLFEEIALGRFEENQDRVKLGKADEDDRKYLQRKAIDALAYIGDADTLELLRADYLYHDPFLRRSIYRTSEEIYWRIDFNRPS